MKTVDELMAETFFPHRTPRSDAYKAGCRAGIASRIEGARIECPHEVGTAEADAWFAGADEGRAVASREMQQ